jgi:hypothetical protein
MDCGRARTVESDCTDANPCHSVACLTGQESAPGTRISLPSTSWISPRASGRTRRHRLTLPRLRRHSWAAWGDSRGAGRGLTSSAPSSDHRSLAAPPPRAGTKMTAEVAILNKSAVALAADSAVTISAGTKEEKVFDTADKLFELCRPAIGIMIYNGMSFAETPLPSLIRAFRGACTSFDDVATAAETFLSYLNEFGRQGPQRVKDDSLRSMVEPLLNLIENRYQEKLNKFFQEPWDNKITTQDDFERVRSEMMDEAIAVYERFFHGQADARFVGKGEAKFSEHTVAVIRDLVEQKLARQHTSQEQRSRIVEVAKTALRKSLLSPGLTGIVVAGFGNKELFPTLVSFEIEGMVSDRLKYIQTNFVDIDREGAKAQVIPFAQKEMVERFLYGLDEGIQKDIRSFCRGTISEIRKLIFSRVTFPNADAQAELTKQAEGAETAFLGGLDREAFAAIRSDSRAEIEDMVEFMPKPELATMAEALVNLTSIKRRVSRGMETVGGAIDVAVISRGEGFVWVKRKHYFPPDLNPRYFQRVERENREPQDAHASTSRRPKTRRRAGKPR